MKQFTEEMKGKAFYCIEDLRISTIIFVSTEPKSLGQYGFFYTYIGHAPLRIHINQIDQTIFENEKDALQLARKRLKNELDWVNEKLSRIEGKDV